MEGIPTVQSAIHDNMFKNILLVAPLFVAGASAQRPVDFQCSSSGPGQNACAGLVRDFCTSMTTIAIEGLNSGSLCYTASPTKCVFSALDVIPNNPGQVNFSPTNCEDVLNNVTRLCGSGAGSGTVHANFNWFISGTSDGSGCNPF